MVVRLLGVHNSRDEGIVAWRSSHQKGGGISINGVGNGDVEITKCKFEENVALDGGGADVSGTPALIQDCIFSNNFAENNGGGIHNGYRGNTRIVRCVLSNNKADYAGGGIQNLYSLSEVIDCTIEGNEALVGGGSETAALLWSG